jgi:penicillin-binding protein 1A
MKLLARTLGSVVAILMAATAALCIWLYFYTADLPSISSLSLYNPAVRSDVGNRDGIVTHVIPGSEMENSLFPALFAAEGQPERRGPIRVAFGAFLSDHPQRAPLYSSRLAREFSFKGSALRRQIDQLRVAEQIHRKFSLHDVLTIYLNHVLLGQNVYGVEDGSTRYFGKPASSLSPDEAALLIGMVGSPNYYSPIQHPERAVERRNFVLDRMTALGYLPPVETERAKASPLLVKQAADSEPAYDYQRCALRVVNQGSPADATILLNPVKKIPSQMPVIKFEILENGEVRNVAVQRSSGIEKIDGYALAWITTIRYEERPLGCGIIESQAAVNINYRIR